MIEFMLAMASQLSGDTMRRLSIFATVAVLLTIAPCANGTEAPKPGDTFFIIGISPPFTKVEVSDGHLDGEKFEQSRAVRMWGINAYWGVPEDGFILVKGFGEPMYGITVIQFHGSAHSIGGTLYSPCEDAGPNGLMESVLSVRGTAPGGAMVFTPPAGKVTYVGSVSFDRDKETLKATASYSNDLEGARNFLKTHHPELADRLEQGSYQIMTAEGSCR